MIILHFNLKKEWFDKIDKKEKSHEYREVKKHWIQRLNRFIEKPNLITECKRDGFPILAFFKNGYQKNAPEFMCEVLGVKIVNGLNTDLKIDCDVYDIKLDLNTKVWI